MHQIEYLKEKKNRIIIRMQQTSSRSFSLTCFSAFPIVSLACLSSIKEWAFYTQHNKPDFNMLSIEIYEHSISILTSCTYPNKSAI